MDELDDLDAFIANIEESAPKEELDSKVLRCQECETPLEQLEGDYICPNCSAQATNILQLEETELHVDETGRVIGGQRVNLERRHVKKAIEYGWAWSTDEAVVHILNLQLNAIEEINLVPDNFRSAVKNMWYKFWIENIAPHIKDEYNESELIPLETLKSLKMRDIEVLVKVRDKVMLPTRDRLKGAAKRQYRMLGTRFYKCRSSHNTSSNVSNISEENEDPDSRCSVMTSTEVPGEINDLKSNAKQPILQDVPQVNKLESRNKTLNTISILTLNRTIAFIEAAARCMNLPDPVFASDIIRVCNQRLVPFFGAHKTLPDGMKLNANDKLVFQKNRPPTALCLTREACLLIHKVYQDKLPLTMPVPKLEKIIERFVENMNLPTRILSMLDSEVNFSSFRQTRSKKFHNRSFQSLPQYDRWAFAILVSQMKKLFRLDSESLVDQDQAAGTAQTRTGRSQFSLHLWTKQMSMRMQLVMSYDPYMLFHPMTDMKNMKSTPQLNSYIELIMSERVLSDTRSTQNRMRWETAFRTELADFLKRELPRPPQLTGVDLDDEMLEEPIDIRHPIQDALRRTQHYWMQDIPASELDFLSLDFSNHDVTLVQSDESWSLYDAGLPDDIRMFGRSYETSSQWPYCFKLLLTIGGYLCYCEPRELLNEIRWVEEFQDPSMRYQRIKRLRPD